MSEEVLLLDISHWVRPVWTEWPEQVGVYMKVTQGTQFADVEWKNHYAEVVEAGKYTGPFHYFKVQNNGALQAEYMWNEIKDYDWDMRPVVDVERYYNQGYSKAVFAARLRNCLLEIERLFGVRPMIYTSRSMWRELVGSTSWASAYDLWVAHYTSYPVPLIPDDWKGKGYRMWQFTSVPLDQNRFHGNHAEYLKWMGKDAPPPPPGPTVLFPGDYRVL
jgi:GH25 family lysozyme M1 (1,4-beta-N-acetylmuramidase)